MSVAPIARLVLALACIAVAAPVAPVVAVEPDPPRLASPEIFGYLPYWDLDARIDFGAITTIAYFGLGAGADGQLVRSTGNGSVTTEYSRWQGAKVQSIIDQAHAAGVKFVLTVERMAWDDGGRAATRALLSNPDARLVLAADIVTEIGSRGLDGVSLDFEPILSDQRDNFAAFLGELRTALDAVNPAYQLTFAATGSQPSLTYQMFGNVTASGAADAVIIMGYPLRGIDARRAGGLAPMYSPYSYDLIQIVDAYLGRVAGDKVILALPWYGRQWPTETADLNAVVQQDRTLYDRPYNIGYSYALAIAIANGRQFDPVEQSAWTAYRWRYCADCPETWREVYYEDVETLGLKYDWAAAKGLRGIGIWALGYDNDQPELWQLLRLKYRGLVDGAAPSGSFALAADERFCRAPWVRLSFALDDGAEGSGAAYVRLSNLPDVGADGLLGYGRTYPAGAEIAWPLDDPATGGSPDIGARSVYAQWRDVAGNWSTVSRTDFDLADIAPTATVTVAGGAQTVNSASVAVMVEQTGGRAIDVVRLSNRPGTADGGLADAVEVGAGTSVDFSLIEPATGGVDVDGRRSIYVQWRDSAGCWSPLVSSRLTLDRRAPTGSLSVVNSPAFTLDRDVEILAPAADETSGVAAVELSNDGLTWQTLPASSEPIAWSAGDTPDGPWTISARWQDGAGNWSDVATTSLLLDTHGPTGAVVLDGGTTATRGDTVTVQATATDEASDVVEVLLSNSAATVDGVLSEALPATPGAAAEWALPGAGTVEGVAEGPHSIYAQWRDAVGHWSDVASASITVDHTAPAVTVPQPGLRAGGQLGLASVPITVSWSAEDPGSGVAEQHLELARDTQAWAPAFSGPASTSGDVEIDRSSAWRLRGSATDNAGNSGASDSDPFSAVVSEDNSPLVTLVGMWRRSASIGASGGATRYATAKRALAKFTFSGRSVAWVAPVGPKRGRAKVFVDGVVVALVDLGAAAQQRMLVFSRTWASVGQHTIKIKVLGTTGRPRVDLDCFVILT